MNRNQLASYLTEHGFYDPAHEHDACGVGLVAAIDGTPRREIVTLACDALKAVWHRGAVDADGKTGDGAGIHLQIPPRFFRDLAKQMKRPVPADAPLAVGMLFLPKKDLRAQEQCRALIESEIQRLGHRIIGWRQVPIDPGVIGEIANDTRPEIEQILVAASPVQSIPLPMEEVEVASAASGAGKINVCDTFERDLYVIRRRIEKAFAEAGITQAYITSLSCRHIVYKGLFKAEQLTAFYPDLLDSRFTSGYAIFHQRFSTNTDPSWALAQPFRTLAHNGEINTLKGNINVMRSHEATMHCELLDKYLDDIRPIIPNHASDTAALDAVMELLVRAGHDAPLAKQILIPPAWSMAAHIPPAHQDMFNCLNTICEPWDGPAAIAATDGRWVIAGMDRGGLRPMRYALTEDGLLLMGSETGMVPMEESQVMEKGKLGPGECIGIDLLRGALYKDRELKDHLAAQHPYSDWVKQIKVMNYNHPLPTRLPRGRGSPLADGNMRPLPLQGEGQGGGNSPEWLRAHQLAVGLTFEDIETILHPMAAEGKEAVGSMGDDTPLAMLSDKPRGFHHFFRQNFSQVTNPPLDSLRERRVMSLNTRFGNDGNFLSLSNSYQDSILLESPVLLRHEMEALQRRFADKITVINTLFDVPQNNLPPFTGGDRRGAAKHSEPESTPTLPSPINGGGLGAYESEKINALRRGLDRIIAEAEAAVEAERPYLLLTDSGRSRECAAIPMILATAAINTHLVKRKMRKRASLLVCSSECCDVHYLAVLIGVGATVVQPWLAEATIRERYDQGLCSPSVLPLKGADRKDSGERAGVDETLLALKTAMEQGLLKIMSKMGISVVSSYRNGYNFEAIGLSRALVSEFFPDLPSRLSGIGMAGIERRVLALHSKAYGATSTARPASLTPLPIGGFYKYRTSGERHAFGGEPVHLLQSAVGEDSYELYRKYAAMVNEQPPVALRQLLDFASDRAPIDRSQVESITDIRKRFVAPAMSLGALSPEAHETLAIAMNRMGGMSNSGEGGEGPERFTPRTGGDNANSVVKQVASARFGVTASYLNHAEELQIKIAQGAKPGEGGQLPGFKVTAEIARLRHATPGVTLISPPPHHDIYSIEDLAQLIYDLKQINPHARVSVKLVSQAGIGTIASGVAKAMADKIVIAGHSGGTGASPYSSIKFAGSPWEMGLAEANQVLTLNRLRHRVRLQTDGGLKTGRDIVMAAMLGAEEYAIGTASLVAMGCILVRQCHSNTCPVGICTQDETLRAKFEGTVEKVVNLFSFIAEDIREILARLGYTRLDDVIGRTDLLTQIDHGGPDLVDLDLNPLLARADNGFQPRICQLSTSPVKAEDLAWRNAVAPSLDEQMLADARESILAGKKVQLAYSVRNTHRSIGARLSSLLVRHLDTQPLADGHITIRLRGSAGQSLGCFLARGITLEVLGDANDYVGKGLSGGIITLRPRPSSRLVPHDNSIIGNTVLYGATEGELFAAGRAGERFAVRNSGAEAVVEGCGAHGCEYMTGGTAVILGPVGDNFAAGMTGGMAFVYDEQAAFQACLNGDCVIAERIRSPHWEAVLHALIRRHAAVTESPRAREILNNWEHARPLFWQVVPKEMIARLAHPLVEDRDQAAGIGHQ